MIDALEVALAGLGYVALILSAFVILILGLALLRNAVAGWWATKKAKRLQRQLVLGRAKR